MELEGLHILLIHKITSWTLSRKIPLIRHDYLMLRTIRYIELLIVREKLNKEEIEHYLRPGVHFTQ